jgi:hypothetical protein
MPNIRVMLWNIRKFSGTKTNIPGMTAALSAIIRGANPDIVVIVEPTSVGGIPGLVALRAQLQGDDNNVNHWAVSTSYETGGECYAFLCRNLGLVRPLLATEDPAAATPEPGTAADPLRNVEKMQFTTWPANWPTAYAPLAPLGPWPRQPLVNLFYRDVLARPAKRRKMSSGQPQQFGGYAQGRGARMPCMAIFHIHTPGAPPNDYYLPIVVCHYWANRSADQSNAGALDQIKEARLLHIAQKFAYRDLQTMTPRTCGYLDINGAAVPIQELMFTGDWNVDFLRNDPAGPFLSQKNHNAFQVVTPILQHGGSVIPAPLAPGAVQGPVPPGPAPAVPFQQFARPPVVNSIPNQNLTSAVTIQGTILLEQTPPAAFQANQAKVAAPGATTRTLRELAFDLTFFAGTRLDTAAMLTPAGAIPAMPADAGLVVDVPANLAGVPVPAGGLPPPQFEVSLIQNHYANLAPGAPVHHANLAPNLSAAGAVLGLQDRWIGANLISDHVPTVVQFVCP